MRRALRIKLEGLIKKNDIRNFEAYELIKPMTENDVYWITILDKVENLMYPLRIIDAIRDIVDFPIVITSTFRSFEHNAKVGGVKKSLHLEGLAIDFRPVGKITSSKFIRRLNRLKNIVQNIILIGDIRTRNLGRGYYPTFIHLDTRGIIGRYSPVSWTKKL
jgi:hypothetical protein